MEMRPPIKCSDTSYTKTFDVTYTIVFRHFGLKNGFEKIHKKESDYICIRRFNTEDFKEYICNWINKEIKNVHISPCDIINVEPKEII